VLIAHAERFSSTSVRWAKSCRSLYKFERLESSHLDNFFGNMNGLSYKVRRRVTNLNAALVLGLGLWVRVVQDTLITKVNELNLKSQNTV
jgi:hypothetical protein